MVRLSFIPAVVVITLVALTSPAQAVIFTGSQGSLSASVDFEIVGTNLVVTLTNTSAVTINDPSQVLTAIFFHGTRPIPL